MKFFQNIIDWFRLYFNIKPHKKDEFEVKDNIIDCDEFEKNKNNDTNKNVSKTKSKFDSITFRKLNKSECTRLNKILKESNTIIRKSNYKEYCLNTRKIHNCIYSFIPLFRISNGKRSDFRYILIYKHKKNNDSNSKLHLVYKLYMEFNGVSYKDNFYKILKSKIVIEKLWKKVEMYISTDNYKKEVSKCH